MDRADLSQQDSKARRRRIERISTESQVTNLHRSLLRLRLQLASARINAIHGAQSALQWFPLPRWSPRRGRSVFFIYLVAVALNWRQLLLFFQVLCRAANWCGALLGGFMRPLSCCLRNVRTKYEGKIKPSRFGVHKQTMAIMFLLRVAVQGKCTPTNEFSPRRLPLQFCWGGKKQ